MVLYVLKYGIYLYKDKNIPGIIINSFKFTALGNSSFMIGSYVNCVNLYCAWSSINIMRSKIS